MIQIPQGQQFQFGIGNHSSSMSFEGLLIKREKLDDHVAVGRSISRLASFIASIRRSNGILSGAAPDAKCHYARSKEEM
jgi:hypothetical protein